MRDGCAIQPRRTSTMMQAAPLPLGLLPASSMLVPPPSYSAAVSQLSTASAAFSACGHPLTSAPRAVPVTALCGGSQAGHTTIWQRQPANSPSSVLKRPWMRVRKAPLPAVLSGSWAARPGLAEPHPRQCHCFWSSIWFGSPTHHWRLHHHPGGQ